MEADSPSTEQHFDELLKKIEGDIQSALRRAAIYEVGDFRNMSSIGPQHSMSMEDLSAHLDSQQQQLKQIGRDFFSEWLQFLADAKKDAAQWARMMAPYEGEKIRWDNYHLVQAIETAVKARKITYEDIAPMFQAVGMYADGHFSKWSGKDIDTLRSLPFSQKREGSIQHSKMLDERTASLRQLLAIFTNIRTILGDEFKECMEKLAVTKEHG